MSVELDRRALLTGALASLGAAALPAKALVSLAPVPEISVVYSRSPLWREMFEAICNAYTELTGDTIEAGTYGYELCSCITDINYDWHNKIMYGDPDSLFSGLNYDA